VNPQGAIAARLEGVPIVWQILDTFTPMMLRHAIMPMVKWLADVVMCTGRAVAEEHPGAMEFGSHLVLFYPPVNIDRFKYSPERNKRARETLGLSQDSFVVGNVGNINLQKGHRTFIRAAAKLIDTIPEAKFVILGAQHENHREYIEGLWREAVSLGLELGVNLIVLDPGVDVPELEPAFDVFWMTSEPRSEGIPTVSEEAMALEIPVLATRVGSIEEIVFEGKTGFVVDPYDIDALADSTVRLFADKNLLRSMGQEANRFAVENFSVENCARSHLRGYQLALNIDRMLN
jgi:glycosyltransferase involved in cell wall biosynthesis